MLEVLISVLLVSVAFLGQASMLTSAVKYNKGASLRIEASALAQDLAERMENNRQAANAGKYVIAQISSTPVTAPKNCGANECDGDELAQYDLAQWQAALIASLPSPRWSITASGTPTVYRISIIWQERRDNAARVRYAGTGSSETTSINVEKTISP